MTNNVESKNTYRLSIPRSLLSKTMRNGIPTRIPMTKFDLYSFWPNHPPMQTSSRHSCVLRIAKCYKAHRIVLRTSLYLFNCPCNSLYCINKRRMQTYSISVLYCLSHQQKKPDKVNLHTKWLECFIQILVRHGIVEVEYHECTVSCVQLLCCRSGPRMCCG